MSLRRVMTTLSVLCCTISLNYAKADGEGPSKARPEIKSIQSLEELDKQLKAQMCPYQGLRNKMTAQGLWQAKVAIQMGFIDDPTISPKISLDYPIIAAIENYLETTCGFSRIQEHFFHRQYQDGFKLDIEIFAASEEGQFSLTLSQLNLENLFLRLQEAQYFIYIGHSRHGKGMDFYPLAKEKARKAIPLYSKSFFLRLPDNLKGIGVLGCDAESYAQAQGAAQEARRRGHLQLIAFEQKTFNFQDSLIELDNILNSF